MLPDLRRLALRAASQLAEVEARYAATHDVLG
jgi:hypothetical protein